MTQDKPLEIPDVIYASLPKGTMYKKGGYFSIYEDSRSYNPRTSYTALLYFAYPERIG